MEGRVVPVFPNAQSEDQHSRKLFLELLLEAGSERAFFLFVCFFLPKIGFHDQTQSRHWSCVFSRANSLAMWATSNGVERNNWPLQTTVKIEDNFVSDSREAKN